MPSLICLVACLMLIIGLMKRNAKLITGYLIIQVLFKIYFKFIFRGFSLRLPFALANFSLVFLHPSGLLIPSATQRLLFMVIYSFNSFFTIFQIYSYISHTDRVSHMWNLHWCPVHCLEGQKVHWISECQHFLHLLQCAKANRSFFRSTKFNKNANWTESWKQCCCLRKNLN